MFRNKNKNNTHSSACSKFEMKECPSFLDQIDRTRKSLSTSNGVCGQAHRCLQLETKSTPDKQPILSKSSKHRLRNKKKKQSIYAKKNTKCKSPFRKRKGIHNIGCWKERYFFRSAKSIKTYTNASSKKYTSSDFTSGKSIEKFTEMDCFQITDKDTGQMICQKHTNQLHFDTEMIDAIKYKEQHLYKVLRGKKRGGALDTYAISGLRKDPLTKVVSKYKYKKGTERIPY